MKKKLSAKSAKASPDQKKNIKTKALTQASLSEIDRQFIPISARMIPSLTPYALTIFLGSFLLFLVQPIIGKYILPWFGGVPSVWTSCMLFFQVTLLVGYGYAHLAASLFRPRLQTYIHWGILVACLFFLPIIPADTWKPAGADSPILRILSLLTIVLGIPYLLLSTTGPLMQAWFTYSFPQTSPYRLFALSNFGSLLALIGYPIFIEPNLTLHAQFYSWSVLFVIFAIACVWCSLSNLRIKTNVEPVKYVVSAEPLKFQQAFFWCALACCASALLLSATNQLSEELSVVPILWVGPLTIYLLSFIICFGNEHWYKRKIWIVVFPVFLLASYFMIVGALPKYLWLQLPIYWGSLFAACMLCHGELSRLKPHPASLTSYYLLIALGGALGGAIVTLFAPLLFRGLWEYPLSLMACCVIIIFKLFKDGKLPQFHKKAIAVVALIFVGTGAIHAMVYQREYVIVAERSFYGIVRIDRGTHDDPVLDARVMLNGRIIHGYQFTNARFRRYPTAYYTADSGIGILMQTLQRKNQAGERMPLNIGVVGLGAGVLAAYGGKGDSFRFYELSPDVIRLASEYFTYLSDSVARKDMIPGDARLSLEKELVAGTKGNFDLLVLDAFTGDSVPLHLLTTEAFKLYVRHLQPEGVIAINISNEHLELCPLIRGLAQNSGLDTVFIRNKRRGLDSLPSDWIIMSSNKKILNSPLITSHASPWLDTRPNLVFTDNFSNLFKLLR